MRIGILGYGNLGRGVECAIKQNPDMELAGGIYETCAGDGIHSDRGTQLFVLLHDVEQWKDKIDVMILCGGSATDLAGADPEICKDVSMS